MQQARLAGQATCVAGEGAVGAQYAVARHDDADWIAPDCRAYRANRGTAADGLCEGAIGLGHACWDGEKALPDFTLKSCARGEIDRYIEALESA